MNPILQKEMNEGRIDDWIVVKVPLSPGVYKEIEQIYGVGSVVHFLEQAAWDRVFDIYPERQVMPMKAPVTELPQCPGNGA